MDSIQLFIDTTNEGIEVVCAALNDLGFEHLEIIDDLSNAQHELEQFAPFWDYVDADALVRNQDTPSVCFYFVPDENTPARIEKTKQRMEELRQMDIGLDLGTLAMHSTTIKEEDWINNWREFYKPLEIGNRLLVVPDWERENVLSNERIKLFLEPGLVFGTGEHQTTQLCLQALEKYIKADDVVFDAGSGSGILSLASLLLGAQFVRAIDIDENAKRISQENARLNEMNMDNWDVLIGNVLQDESIQNIIAQNQYDVIVANIVANVIIPLAPLAAQWIKADGYFISSGIIDERADEVEKAIISNQFSIEERIEKDGWVCFVARRRNHS